MKRFRLPLLGIALALLLAGCADQLVNEALQPRGAAQRAADQTTFATFSKLRNGHLVPQGPGAVDLVVLFSIPSPTADSALQAYPELSAQKVLKRNDGPGNTPVVYGAAVTFPNDDDDDDGLDDLFSAFELDDDIGFYEPDLGIGIAPQFTPLADVPGQFLPWGIQRIGAGGSVTGASTVDLYVLDSGVGTVDLNVVETMDFVGDMPTPTGESHGYHVSATAGAIHDTTGVVGVAPNVRVHSFRVLDNLGLAQFSTVVTALDTVISRKVANPSQPMVVNLSLGARVDTTQYNVLDEAVEAAVAQGIVVVVSAGNDGIDASLVTPAHAAGAVTVGAYDSNRRFASYSNWGALVDLLAPGTSIPSLGFDADGTVGLLQNTGTSMAAPHVAGAAVRYLAANPAATPAQVRDALVNAGRPTVRNVPFGTTNKTVWVRGL
jgi:subtilisin family serine protease